MNAATQTKRRNLLARVHIAKKDLALDDGAYRALLRSAFRVNSSGALTVGQLYRLIEIFCEKGWKPGRSGHRPAMPAGSAIPQVGCSAAQWRHVRWLQKELRWNDTNLRGYFRHVAGVDHERFLTVATAREVIAGMRQTLKWDQEHPELDAGPLTMPWGKYKGASIEALPSSYLRWLAENLDETKPATRRICLAADAEWQQRERFNAHV